MWLADHASVFGNHLGGGRDVNWIDGGVQLAGSLTSLKVGFTLEGQGHDDFLEGSISGTFPNSIDSALQLASSVLCTSQRVGGSQAEIVLAMRAKDNLVGSLHVRAKFCHKVSKFPRHVPPGGVGNVQGGCPLFDDRREDLIQKFGIRTPGIFGRKFNIVAAQALGELDSVHGNLGNLLGCFLEFGFHVNRTRGDKGVNSRKLGSFDGIPGSLNVLGVGPGQTANDRDVSVFKDLVSNHIGNLLDSGKVVRRSNGETCLDNVHTEFRKHFGDFEFFSRCQGGTRALLSVTKGGIKDPHIIWVWNLSGNVRWALFANLKDFFGGRIERRL
mmetsp:Transcript_1257/g.2571  ORF Transcript_1257/g.2571 Transcript_1257/m.2571 type:complete len:329 (+) Transcript_1257:888-1874(+)